MVVVSRIGPSDSRPESAVTSGITKTFHTNSMTQVGLTIVALTWIVDVNAGNAKQITEGHDWLV